MILVSPNQIELLGSKGVGMLQRAWFCVSGSLLLSGDLILVSVSECVHMCVPVTKFVSHYPVCLSGRVQVFQW